jgi:4-hydroxy-tetrahydrodipicolinate reductase
MRLLIVGAGRMGQAVAAEATAAGHVVLGPFGRGAVQAGTLENLGPDAAIEFTVPDAAEAVVTYLLERGIRVVSGTTGWDDGLARVRARVAAEGGTFLHAANFSVGVQLLLRGAEALAQAMRGQTAFEAAIVEEHHSAKLDAPSGTARLLQRTVEAADPARPVPITSIRVGRVPGTHTLVYDAAFERITLVHEARDRRLFAAGAVLAAERLAGRTGVLTFADVLFGDPA